MEYQQDPLAALQAIYGHYIGRHASAAHVLTDADDRVQVMVGLLDASVGLAGDIAECGQLRGWHVGLRLVGWWGYVGSRGSINTDIS